MLCKLIKGLFYVLLFVTPLIFVDNTNELYEFPKMFFVYFVGTTIIFLFVVDVLARQNLQLRRPTIFVLLLLASFTISSLFSVHLYTSVWGYYMRFNGGLMSVLLFFGLYFVAINTFKAQDYTNLFYTLTIGSIPVSVYAIVQHLNSFNLRVYSTFGQPNWLAAYFVMILPIALFYFVQNACGARKLPAVFWGLVFTINYLGTLYTYSLSGLLGLVFAIAIFAVLNFAAIRSSFVYVLVLIGVCALLSVATPTIYFQRFTDAFLDLKRFTAANFYVYAAEEEHKLSDPGFIRKGIWQGTINLILSSPKNFLIGTGPETFPYAFQPFRTRELNYSSEWDFILNKPHNYYLEVFAQNGVIGFVVYLLLVFWSLKTKHAFLVPSLVGFYVTNFFGWPTVSTSLLFWLFLSALYAVNTLDLLR